jgi:hypothetical protein
MPSDYREVKTSGQQLSKLAESELTGTDQAHAVRDFSPEELAQQESAGQPERAATSPINAAIAATVSSEGSTARAVVIQDAPQPKRD